MVTQGRINMVATMPQVGLYTNVNILSILYEIIYTTFSGFMHFYRGSK